jgi:phage host-nuclease inhibitor protein Gam
MDVESKSRRIFDLERDNKCLIEEVQNIRRFRTMETIEQVIIAKLKEEIMALNKRMIEMQAEYYRNQKLMMSKYGKDGGALTDNDKETIKKL